MIARDRGTLAQITRLIGVRVKVARTRQGLLAQDVAGIVGISPTMMSLVERGKRRPNLPLLVTLSRVLGVPLHTLFRGF